ncbi:MAG: ABC transporter substrate-binding protein [Alphaproteobacteria bacterium]|nr:ABC transporter substrate-binding protein [Alphaproteobacteria bacterium]
MPVVGYISAASRAEVQRHLVAFERGLARMGFVDGKTVRIEYRFAEARFELIPTIADEFVRRHVDVICTANNAGAVAAKAATSEIPIVFVVGVDPIGLGLVSEFNRPEGNATGAAVLASELEPKRLELLRELVPEGTLVAALVNPENPNARDHRARLPPAAVALGLHLDVIPVRNAADIDAAFEAMARQGAGAMLATIDPFLLFQRRKLIDLARRSRIRAMYPLRDFVDDGGLISYGNDLADATQQMGIYAGRILRGVKPASLPVQQPTKFELVVNIGAAKAIGATIPPAILARADEVIE